ncbi:MAG: hypothetical protein M1825_003628 [Sarcosagium campestre]|nr:MAG: hypothetical protein M1825_003628 [Sarcosagium campestre]
MGQGTSIPRDQNITTNRELQSQVASSPSSAGQDCPEDEAVQDSIMPPQSNSRPASSRHRMLHRRANLSENRFSWADASRGISRHDDRVTQQVRIDRDQVDIEMPLAPPDGSVGNAAEFRPLSDTDIIRRDPEVWSSASVTARRNRRSALSRIGARITSRRSVLDFGALGRQDGGPSSVNTRRSYRVNAPSSDGDEAIANGEYATQSDDRFPVATPLSSTSEMTIDRQITPPSRTRDSRSAPPFSAATDASSSLMEHESTSSISTGAMRPRRSRLSRVRNSLTVPVASLMHNGSNREYNDTMPDSAGRRSPDRWSRRSNHTFPRLPMPNFGSDLRVPRTSTMFPSASRSNHADDVHDDRLSHTNDRHIRGLPGSRRRAQPRLHHEDQAAMLSRLLSGAAAATAASLVGNTDRAFSEAHDVASDGGDGSFDGFLQALQNGSLAAALRNGGNGGEASSDGSAFSPVNFFRMFRFGSTSDSSGRNNEANPSSADGARDQARNVEGGRMVPVIIVGIRSVTAGDGTTRDDDAATPPVFDALSTLPMAMSNGAQRSGAGTFVRRTTDRRARFGRSRRASMGSVNAFPSNYDSQRHQRAPMIPRPATTSRPFFGSALPSVLSDSPPGPHPPPSTPADYGLSAFSTGNNTPSRRTSSASGASPPSTSQRRPSWREESEPSPGRLGPEPSTRETSASPSNTRRRRLSDGEFTRYHDFGSGSSRRNGIVGDADVGSEGGSRTAGESQSEGTRSWIIYVLGGSYPEDHPILTTPSLFTDSPTYEDMLLLSSILGPAKPPVATEEDVASAPGLYRVGHSDGLMVASSSKGEQVIIGPNERCLVCLCEYEVDEDLRQLAQCGHLYHRECIDTWLTTGRNSCPLCRGRGVGDSTDGNPPAVPTESSA